MSDNLDEWTKANDNRTYYALRLTDAYVNGNMTEVERFADLYRKAEAELDRLNREYLGEQK